MSEGIHYIPEPAEEIVGQPDKKNKTILWIILAVVAVILICCCLTIGLALLLGFSISNGEVYSLACFPIWV